MICLQTKELYKVRFLLLKSKKRKKEEANSLVERRMKRADHDVADKRQNTIDRSD